MTLFSDSFVLVGRNCILKENIFCTASLFTVMCLDLCTDVDLKRLIELSTCDCCYGGHSRVGGLRSKLLACKLDQNRSCLELRNYFQRDRVLRSRTNITAALINSEGLISLCISELELKLILKKLAGLFSGRSFWLFCFQNELRVNSESTC